MAELLIVANVRFYCEGLAEILSRSPGLRVAGMATDVEGLFPLLAAGDAQIVLLDAALPDAIHGVRRIASAAPHVKIVALALPETDRDVIAWAEAGLAGYVSRDRSISDLIATVESVARGELVCPPRVAAALLRRVGVLAHWGRIERAEPNGAQLTFREREIATLIELGLSNKEIAYRLGIQLATIKTHVHHILEKLRVRRRIQIPASVRRM